jgi:thiol-disulfide isomerase/thioredoxin
MGLTHLPLRRAAGAIRFDALAMTAALALAACSRFEAPAPAGTPHVRLTQAPAVVVVDAIVRDALAIAVAEKRTLVVYVGAGWCEPCQRFHRAAESGELDAMFPSLTMLEFDLDRDGQRLAAAGYASKYIPLFALPSQDGKASGKQVAGAIKGEDAVGYIAPRLKELLAL